MSDDGRPDDRRRNELVTGATAAQLDVRSRLAGLTAIVLGVVAVAQPSPWNLVIGAVSIALLVTAIALAVSSSRTAAREREAGYSTLFDFAGFALRHPRTKQLLRAADAAPASPGRRSVFRSMLSVKPGTVLAKRLEEDEKDER